MVAPGHIVASSRIFSQRRLNGHNNIDSLTLLQRRGRRDRVFLLLAFEIKTPNVAGPRASKEPKFGEFVKEVLGLVWPG